MELEGSLPHSKVLATCPYPEPDWSSPSVRTPTFHFLKIHLNIILPSTPGSPQWSYIIIIIIIIIVALGQGGTSVERCIELALTLAFTVETPRRVKVKRIDS